jgi:hypothetical protein
VVHDPGVVQSSEWVQTWEYSLVPFCKRVLVVGCVSRWRPPSAARVGPGVHTLQSFDLYVLPHPGLWTLLHSFTLIIVLGFLSALLLKL